MNALCKILLTGSLITASMLSVANDFAPMQKNDQKIFKENNREFSVDILETQGSWKKYSAYMGRTNAWINASGNSSKVFWWNADYGQAELLVDFNYREGRTYNTRFDGCNSKATIVSESHEEITAAGTFSNATLVTFSDNQCRDAGLVSAVFARGVGLVSYTQLTIAGPVRTELVSGTIAGVSYPMFSGLEVTAQFPAARVLSNVQDTINAYLTVHNKSNETQTFNFTSSQQFDIVILDQFGTPMNVWSANKRFTQAFTSVEIPAGESYQFGGSIALIDNAGQPLDVGTYTIRIYVNGSNQPEASVYTSAQISAEAPLYIDRRITINN